MPRLILQDVREQVALRLNAGQRPQDIGTALGLGLKTIYRMKKQFTLQGEEFIATPLRRTARENINRATLVEMSRLLSKSPKLTLAELRDQCVALGLFEADKAPDLSTLWRRLQKVGYRWKKPLYQDARAKRTVRQYESCMFRKAQDEGLDSTTLLSMDESFIYYEQATRSWGTIYNPAKLPKDKSVPRRALLCTVAFKRVQGQNKGFLHWVLIHPRPTFAPLEPTIQQYEIQPEEKKELRELLNEAFIAQWTKPGLATELNKLGVRAPVSSVESMRETLRRIGRSGNRVGELRATTGKGRPSKGGRCEPFYGTARAVSEYLHQCMVPGLGGEGGWNEEGHECKLKTEEGLRGCPDYVMREANFQPKDYVLLWDNASTHSPSTPNQISPFAKYATEVLGLKEPGVINLPAYSPKLAPCELVFSYLKRGLRKTTPTNIPELVDALRAVSKKITGDMIANWFKKCGYIIPGEPEESRPEDPNKDVPNLCTLAANTKNFEVRQHIACYDTKGELVRHKPPGYKRWKMYTADEDLQNGPEDLQDLSVVKRSGVKPKKRRRVGECAPPDESAKVRYTGLNSLPSDLPHASYDKLFQNDSDNTAIERILDERQVDGNREYKVRWVGFDQGHDEWVPEDRFTAGLNNLLLYWKEKNRVQDGQQAMNNNKKKANEPPPTVKPINRDKLAIGDAVAILAPKGASLPFYLGKVMKISPKKIGLQWYGHNKTVDGTYVLQFQAKKGKGVGPPITATVWRETVIDTVGSMRGKKKGKVEKGELKRLLALAGKAKA